MGSVQGDVRLAFGRAGEGPNPVLALHGITAQHRAFDAVARHLRHPDGMVAMVYGAGVTPRSHLPVTTGSGRTRGT